MMRSLPGWPSAAMLSRLKSCLDNSLIIGARFFKRLPGAGYHSAASPELLQACERAVSLVDPLLKQINGFPGSFLEPVAAALAYSRKLADGIPGPVALDRKSYAADPLVHAFFSSMDSISEVLGCSQPMREYCRTFPGAGEAYALMGMRRSEKKLLGMELAGDLIQREVPQDTVYFSGHTIEYPAASEQEARDRVVWALFDCLAGHVARQIGERKQQKQLQLQEKDRLMSRLHSAPAQERPALEEALSGLLAAMQATIASLEPRACLEDFKNVLLNPAQYLRLEQDMMVLDSMGIRRQGAASGQGTSVVFSDLIGFDRRKWTVAVVYFSPLHIESSAACLEEACRKLAL